MSAALRCGPWAACLIAVAACGEATPEPVRDGGAALELVAAYRRGDPVAMAVSEDGTRLWSVDGAMVTEWELAAGPRGPHTIAPEERRRFPLDVTVMSLLHADGRLFAAGGSFGLWSLDLGHRQPRPRRLVRREGLVCTDVTLDGPHLLATFGAARGSRLLVLHAADFELLGEAQLPDGVAWAVDARDGRAWVALGAGGLARVDLGDPRSPRVEPGPGAQAFPVEPGSDYGPNVVRDVAVSATHVHAAADGAGLASLALAAPWSPAAVPELTPLELEDRETYAARVAVRGSSVLVGTNLAPVRAQEGAPFGLHGWMDARLNVGGVQEGDFARGVGQGLIAFERVDGSLVRRASVTGRGGWRTLELGGRVYEQHIGEGWAARSSLFFELEVLAGARPVGYAAMDGGVSLRDPRLVLFGADPAGSRTAGWLARQGARIDVRAESDEPAPLGLLVGAQWLDPEVGDEWCLVGEGFGCRLVRVVAEAPTSSESWPLEPVLDPDGARPLAYFSSTVDGDVVHLAQARARWGLLGLSARALTAAARAAPPGTALAVEPLFHVRTHALGEVRWMFTWKPALYDAADGRRVAVVPSGLRQDEGGGTGRAATRLFDVSRAAEGEVEPLGGFFAPREEGHALAAQVAVVDGRAFAFVVDFVHGLDVLDVTDPRAPELVGGWAAPVDPFDGRRSNVLDLELERRADGGLDVWLAAGRLGVVRLDASDPERFDLPVRETVDTPGWAVGLCLREVDGERVLLVGDQKGGLREYR